MDDRNLVVDANIVVDTILAVSGKDTSRSNALKKLWALMGTSVLVEGELVIVRPVVSRHIAKVSRTVLLRKGLTDSEIDAGLRFVVSRVHATGGTLERADEDYKALSRRAWARHGTDTEDEAVLACAERNAAAVLTDDREFRQYLGDRKVACFSATEFISVTVR